MKPKHTLIFLAITIVLLFLIMFISGCAVNQNSVVHFSEANWNKIGESKEGKAVLRQDVTHVFERDGKKYKYVVPTVNRKIEESEDKKSEKE